MPGGWLLLLCAILFVWQPLVFAAELAVALPSIGVRGLPAVAELTAHGAIAAVSVAAGWSLWIRSAHGPALAMIAIIGSTAAGGQSLYWTALPRQTSPGSELLLATVLVAHAAIWVAYLRCSERVQAIRSR